MTTQRTRADLPDMAVMPDMEREWGGDGDGAFAGLNKQQERSGHLCMDQLLGFLQSAILNKEHADFVTMACGLGLREYHAPQNLRFRAIYTLQKQLAAVVDDEALYIAPRQWSAALCMEVLPEVVRHHTEAQQIIRIQNTIRHDQSIGVFQDLSDVHDFFDNCTWDQAYSAQAIEMACRVYFIREAFNLAMVSMSRGVDAGTSQRTDNSQAGIARMVSRMTTEAMGRQRGAHKGNFDGGRRDD